MRHLCLRATIVTLSVCIGFVAVAVPNAYAVAPPNVTRVSPSSGPQTGGTTVRIDGSNFVSVVSVAFGSTPAISFSVPNRNSVNAVAPPGVGVVDVTVTTAVATTPLVEADRFSFVALPTRTIAGGNGTGSAANQTSYPAAIAVDSSGNTYVVDIDNARVQEFARGSTSTTDGVVVAGGHGDGSAANQLSGPSAIAVDAVGNVYIADSNNNRIQEWAPSAITGVTVAGGNGAGSGPDQLEDPSGVALDHFGNLIVADSINNRVQSFLVGAPFAADGITIAGELNAGHSQARLDYPTAITTDAAGNLYVTDTNNQRIQRFAAGSIGGDNAVTAAGDHGTGSDANQLTFPYGLAVDSSSNLFVADTNNDRVQLWSPGATTGITVAGGNGTGGADNQLSAPEGVVVDGSGDIYVADSGNSRIQAWFVAPSVAMTSSVNPSTFHQSVTFTVEVADPSASLSDLGGSMAFYDSATLLATRTVTNGSATLFEKNLAVGSHDISAVYARGGIHAPLTTEVVSQSVGQATTTTTVESSLPNSIVGKLVTLRAMVWQNNPGINSTIVGSVEFFDGPTSLGTSPISNHRATIGIKNFAVGSRSITATYSGSADQSGSTSIPIIQTINLGPTATTIRSSRSVVDIGKSVTFTANVYSIGISWTINAGSVDFYDGATIIGSVSLVNGRATFSINTLSAGSHQITAVFEGIPGRCTTSQSSPITQMIGSVAPI